MLYNLTDLLTAIGNFLSTILKLQGEQFPVVMVALVFTILAFIFFAKILRNFSMFSSGIATLLGLGLSLLLVITGTVRSIILFLTITFRFIGAILVLLVFFVGYFILQLLIDRKLRKDERLRRKLRIEESEAKLEAIAKGK